MREINSKSEIYHGVWVYSAACIAFSVVAVTLLRLYVFPPFNLNSMIMAFLMPGIITPIVTYILFKQAYEITKHKCKLEAALLQLNKENEAREKAEKELKAVSGLLPICASCKKIRDDDGEWQEVETYVERHSDAEFTHGMCDACLEELYGKENWYQKYKGTKK